MDTVVLFAPAPSFTVKMSGVTIKQRQSNAMCVDGMKITKFCPCRTKKQNKSGQPIHKTNT